LEQTQGSATRPKSRWSSKYFAWGVTPIINFFKVFY
jgi:hypothetical protein